MTRNKSMIPTKEKVIQIRVSEETFLQFSQICESRLKKTKSEVGNRIIKKFIEVSNNGRAR